MSEKFANFGLKFGRRRLKRSAHLGSFSKNNKAVLSYCISMLNDTRTVKTNLKRFIIGKERLSAWATRKKMPFLELFQHFVIFLCWFFHFIRLLNIKTTTFRAAILEMSEILKLPTENKVILKLFFESVTASSRQQVLATCVASGGLTSRGLQNPTFGTTENLRHYRIPIELEKTKFRGWQAARNGEKFQGHVFNSKISITKNTEETQGCIERNKTFIKKVFKLFRRPGWTET